MAVNAPPLASAIYTGWVRHRRHLPRPHSFRYRVFQLLLDLDELDRVFEGRWLWSVGRRNLAEFRRSDYHGDPTRPLADCVRDTVATHLGRRPTGPIRLLAHLRYFGHCFNPVCFYYGYADDGQTLEWVMAEITNTPWGERHAYVLPLAEAEPSGASHAWHFRKRFHVSPFIGMHRDYDWRFEPPTTALRVHMNVTAGSAREFDATLSLERRPLTGPALARCLLHHPFITLRVVSAIYWQALLLWLKRTPFHPHPDTRRPDTDPHRNASQ